MPQASRRGAPESSSAAIVFSIGHSTHPIEAFIALLRAHRIETLADVRSFPGSRRWPQFNRAALETSTAAAAIGYRWLKELGGRRHGGAAVSPHVGWRLPAFRAYADYTGGEEFARGLAELGDIANRSRCAFMCSEGLWWRCHRRIISDHLVLLGWQVMHIMPGGQLVQHKLPDFARPHGGGIIYDAVAGSGPPRTGLGNRGPLS